MTYHINLQRCLLLRYIGAYSAGMNRSNRNLPLIGLIPLRYNIDNNQIQSNE